MPHFGRVCRLVDPSCKLLKIRLFKPKILLDTALLRLIRFPQKALMDENLRWNYSPLKEKAAQVAGWPFCLEAEEQFSVLSWLATGLVFPEN